jgi:hypothetical protein
MEPRVNSLGNDARNTASKPNQKDDAAESAAKAAVVRSMWC